MKYSLVLDNPKEFYSDIHRTQHFIKFTNKEEAAEEIDMADKEDFFGWEKNRIRFLQIYICMDQV